MVNIEQNTQPLVSIIVPVYNQELYLQETLGYIRNQTYENLEIIMVDDGSTDDSILILEENAKKDDRIRIIHQKNQYAGTARNKGIDAASGKYLMFLDSDDLFEPTLVEKLATRAEEEQADMVFCAGDKLIEATGQIEPFYGLMNKTVLAKVNARNFCPRKDLKSNLYEFTTPVPWNKIFRSSFVKEHNIRFASHSSSNDAEFVWAAFVLADTVSGVDESLVHYRIRKSSISQTKTKNKDNHSKAYLGHMAFLKERQYWDDLKEAYRKKYLGGAAWHLSTLAKTDTLEHMQYWREKWASEFRVLGKDGDDLRYTSHGDTFYTLFEPDLVLIVPNLDTLRHMQNIGLLDKGNEAVSIIVPIESNKEIPKWLITSHAWTYGRIHIVQTQQIDNSDDIISRCISLSHGNITINISNTNEKEERQLERYIWQLNSLKQRASFMRHLTFSLKKRKLHKAHKRCLSAHIKALSRAFTFVYKKRSYNSKARKIAASFFNIETDDIHCMINCLGLHIRWIRPKQYRNLRKMRKLILRMNTEKLTSLLNIDPVILEKISRAHRLLHINRDEINSKTENITSNGVVSEPRQQRLIVSLTSYPARMYDLHLCLYSLLTQAEKPDKVILWLAPEQFPNGESDIPKKVLDLKQWGLEIRWCPDYRSFKKIIPALMAFPDDVIVTADDDLYYSPDWLAKLWNAYQKGGIGVYAHRCHHIKMKNGEVTPYNAWEKCVTYSTPSYLNFPTSGGGVLYAPHSLHKDVLLIDKARQLCPQADDIWLWGMSVLAGNKVTLVDKPNNSIVYVNPEREVGLNEDGTLWSTNKIGENDKQLEALLNEYPAIMKAIQEAATIQNSPSTIFKF